MSLPKMVSSRTHNLQTTLNIELNRFIFSSLVFVEFSKISSLPVFVYIFSSLVFVYILNGYVLHSHI